MLNITAFSVVRAAMLAAVSLATLVVPQAPANAYSFRTKMACATDYYAYCSQHGIESQGLRQCMNTNGSKLTTSCIKALIAEGEISTREANRRLVATGRTL